MAKIAKAAAKAEMAQYGLLEFISTNLSKFKASDYGAVQRAVKLAEIIDRGILEANQKRVEVFTKYGIKQGESAEGHPKLAELVEELNVINNEESSVSIKDLQIFTVEEFEQDAMGKDGISYQDAGVLGKWLVKEG